MATPLGLSIYRGTFVSGELVSRMMPQIPQAPNRARLTWGPTEPIDATMALMLDFRPWPARDLTPPIRWKVDYRIEVHILIAARAVGINWPQS